MLFEALALANLGVQLIPATAINGVVVEKRVRHFRTTAVPRIPFVPGQPMQQSQPLPSVQQPRDK